MSIISLLVCRAHEPCGRLSYIYTSAKPLSADRLAWPSSSAEEGSIIQTLSFLGEYFFNQSTNHSQQIVFKGMFHGISSTARYPIAQAPFHAIDVTVSSDFCQPCHTTLYPSHNCIINIEHLFSLSCISFV